MTRETFVKKSLNCVSSDRDSIPMVITLRPDRIESDGFSRNQRLHQKYVKHCRPSKLAPNLITALTNHEVRTLRFNAREPDNNGIASGVGQGDVHRNGLADCSLQRYLEGQR